MSAQEGDREELYKIPGLAERIWPKVTKTDSCWLWTGDVGGSGYGRIGVVVNGRRYRPHVHRIVWELEHGAVPEGLQLDHLCRVRPCVNPDHLEPVTPSVNQERRFNRNSEKTHCLRGHPLGEPDSRGRRSCRPCKLAWHRAHPALVGAGAIAVLAALLACTPVHGHKSHPSPVTSAPASPHRTSSGWVPTKQPTPTCTGTTHKPPSSVTGVQSSAPSSPPATRVTSRQAPVTPVASRAVTPSSGIGPPLAQTGPLVGQQAIAGCGVTAVGLLLTWLGMNRKNNRRERGGHR